MTKPKQDKVKELIKLINSSKSITMRPDTSNHIYEILEKTPSIKIDELYDTITKINVLESKLIMSGIKIPLKLSYEQSSKKFYFNLCRIVNNTSSTYTFDCSLISNGNIVIDYFYIMNPADIIYDVRSLIMGDQPMDTINELCKAIYKNEPYVIYNTDTLDRLSSRLLDQANDSKLNTISRSNIQYCIRLIILITMLVLVKEREAFPTNKAPQTESDQLDFNGILKYSNKLVFKVLNDSSIVDRIRYWEPTIDNYKMLLSIPTKELNTNPSYQPQRSNTLDSVNKLINSIKS
jgi:hypothetical protein